ncbi:MAG: hypothetical protein DRJ07_20535 [Bacteroidetes bacterium]|nr:MAG: hypothetical protein DRJ07_20535 [Bacteroidota bacterium]
MKFLKILPFLFVLSFSSFAQSFDGKGDAKINLGYDIYGHGNGIRGSFDIGLCDLFSVGAGAAYYFDNDKNDYYLFARTAMHLGLLLDFPEQLDMYPGISLGYLSGNDIGYDAYLGIRYFFTEKIGVFAEIGNTGSVGLSYSF